MCVRSHLEIQTAKLKHNVPNHWTGVCLFKWLLLWYKARNSTNFLWICQNDHRLQRREKLIVTAAASTGFCRQPFSFHIKPIHSKIYRKFLFRLPLLVVVHTLMPARPYIHFIFSPFFLYCSSVRSWIVWILEMKREILPELFYFQCFGNNSIRIVHKKLKRKQILAEKKNCRSKSGSPWVNMNAKSKSRVATATTPRSAEHMNERTNEEHNLISFCHWVCCRITCCFSIYWITKE